MEKQEKFKAQVRTAALIAEDRSCPAPLRTGLSRRLLWSSSSRWLFHFLPLTSVKRNSKVFSDLNSHLTRVKGEAKVVWYLTRYLSLLYESPSPPLPPRPRDLD